MHNSITIRIILCCLLGSLAGYGYTTATEYIETREKTIQPLTITEYFCPDNCNQEIFTNMQPDTCIFYDVSPELSHKLVQLNTALYVDEYATRKNVTYTKIIKQKGRGIMHLKICTNQTHTLLGSTNPTDNGLDKNLNDIITIKSRAITKQVRSVINSEFVRVPTKPIEKKNMKLCLSPWHNCAYEIIEKIDNANQSIYVAAFSLTHKGIQQSLFRAKKRGVKVELLLDKGQCNKGCSKELFQQIGIPITFYSSKGKMHLKQLIIDGKLLITGSMNFSENGNNYNIDIAAFIEDEKLAKKYEERITLFTLHKA